MFLDVVETDQPDTVLAFSEPTFDDRVGNSADLVRENQTRTGKVGRIPGIEGPFGIDEDAVFFTFAQHQKRVRPVAVVIEKIGVRNDEVIVQQKIGTEAVELFFVQFFHRDNVRILQNRFRFFSFKPCFEYHGVPPYRF